VNDRSLRIGVAAVAAAGLALTAYLLYARESGAQLVCTTGGCQTVQESRYAEIFGLPVAALGLVTYVWLLLTSWSRTELARAAQAAVALAACVFSTYLVYVQLHLINAICELCLVSDGLVAVAAVLALLRLRNA
jgi:uncharacterized membrane protein